MKLRPDFPASSLKGKKRSLWSRMKNSRFLQSGFRFAGGSILSGGIAAFADPHLFYFAGMFRHFRHISGKIRLLFHHF